MSGPSIHRAMCKKVACLECDSLETPVGPSPADVVNRFLAWRGIGDMFFAVDSTMQPGRRITADWDFNRLMEEMADEQ